jgi:hypothetical protein
VLYSVIKIIRYGKDAPLYTHTSALISVFVVSFYYLYLSLTKRALDVFNCNPISPDDGYTYTTFTSLSCDRGGLCRCGDPSGAQVRLLPMAIVFLVLYSFGYPLFIAIVLNRNSSLVKQDQYLRAHGVGEKRATNPETYDLRKRYAKLYYQFRPRFCTFWILVLLARKFWIAFAALLFRGNPTFQMAVILLILFASLVMQVAWKPYLSSGDNQSVIDELEVLVERAAIERDFVQYIKIHDGVQKSLVLDVEQTRKQHEKKSGKRMGNKRSKSIAGAQLEVRQSNGGVLVDDRRQYLSKKSRQALQYFANLNTLEFILLSCGIFVCLAGIMFESSTNDRRTLVQNQTEFISWVVSIVVIFSFVYYIMFFLAEIAPTDTAWIFRLWMFLFRKTPEKVEDEYIDNNIQLEENPLFATKKIEVANNTEMEKKVEKSLNELKEAQSKNKLLREELYNKKKIEQIAEQQRKSGGRNLPKDSTEKQKKEFGREKAVEAVMSRSNRAIKFKDSNKVEEDEEEEPDDV